MEIILNDAKCVVELIETFYWQYWMIETGNMRFNINQDVLESSQISSSLNNELESSQNFQSIKYWRE